MTRVSLGSFSGHHSPLLLLFLLEGKVCLWAEGSQAGLAAGLQDTAMSSSLLFCSQELPAVISHCLGEEKCITAVSPASTVITKILPGCVKRV